jgi:hypothetical protein
VLLPYTDVHPVASIVYGHTRPTYAQLWEKILSLATPPCTTPLQDYGVQISFVPGVTSLQFKNNMCSQGDLEMALAMCKELVEGGGMQWPGVLRLLCTVVNTKTQEQVLPPGVATIAPPEPVPQPPTQITFDKTDLLINLYWGNDCYSELLLCLFPVTTTFAYFLLTNTPCLLFFCSHSCCNVCTQNDSSPTLQVLEEEDFP